MDNYIVRILRRDGPGQLDGVVETVETGKRKAFHNAEELWAILDFEPDPQTRKQTADMHEQD